MTQAAFGNHAPVALPAERWARHTVAPWYPAVAVVHDLVRASGRSTSSVANAKRESGGGVRARRAEVGQECSQTEYENKGAAKNRLARQRPVCGLAHLA